MGVESRTSEQTCLWELSSFSAGVQTRSILCDTSFVRSYVKEGCSLPSDKVKLMSIIFLFFRRRLPLPLSFTQAREGLSNTDSYKWSMSVQIFRRFSLSDAARKMLTA
jgi:hypothetical protein